VEEDVEQSKTRDAERSRAAILDAAEALFAERGFEAVTLSQVGASAGVSRGTPGYFFGTKEALYTRVVERAAATLREHVAVPGRGLDQTVGAFLELVERRPALVKLIDGRRGDLAGEPHAEAFRDAFGDSAGGGDHASLVALALCWFPVSHPGAARALGVDPAAPGFARTWRERVVAVAGLQGPNASVSPPAAAVPPPVEPSPAAPPSVDLGAARGDDGVEPFKKKKKKKKKKG
jgi:AcrR family transcriptional regulator